MDIIKIKNSPYKDNVKNLTLETGELALVRENMRERLYCKNTDDKIVPIHRIVNGGEIELPPPPTIQEAWINTRLAFWAGDAAAMNQVKFNSSASVSGDFIPPTVSDFDRLISLSKAFSGCTALDSLDLSDWNTSSIVDMGSMFASCTLVSLDLSSFDTSNVTNIGGMFDYCNSLTSLDLSSFDTSNVIWATWMFNGCTNLTTLDLSSFIITNEIKMDFMFNGCSSLNNITCKQSFKDYCLKNSDNVRLNTAMREGGSGTWISVD